jgi:hypothetical protein
LIVLLTGQYIAFNNIYIDKYKCNFADEIRTQYIGQAIINYQETTGEKVTKIAFYDDADTEMPQYPGLYGEGDLVISSYCTSWSDINAINYYLGTDYEKTESDERYVEYFSSQDWQCLSEEQLIFEGDTLHLCVY